MPFYACESGKLASTGTEAANAVTFSRGSCSFGWFFSGGIWIRTGACSTSTSNPVPLDSLTTPFPKSPALRLTRPMQILKMRSRREAQRLLEKEEYQKEFEGAEEGEIVDLDPEFEGLQEASGLATSREWELASPKGLPHPEVTSYVVIRKTVNLLEFPLPTTEIEYPHGDSSFSDFRIRTIDALQ